MYVLTSVHALYSYIQIDLLCTQRPLYVHVHTCIYVQISYGNPSLYNQGLKRKKKSFREKCEHFRFLQNFASICFAKKCYTSSKQKIGKFREKIMRKFCEQKRKYRENIAKKWKLCKEYENLTNIFIKQTQNLNIY